jgi:hypothetical protein
MPTQIQLRRDTASDWTSNNPTLALGELGWESDTNKFKIGDGSTAWTSLDYTSDGTAISQLNTNVTVADSGSGTITATVDGTTEMIIAAGAITGVGSITLDNTTAPNADGMLANKKYVDDQIATLSYGDMSDLVDDTTPQLGGDLDVNGQDIISTSNADIDIAPHGTGDVVLKADTVTVGDAAAAATLRSSGAGTLTVTTGGTEDLILSTNNGTNSGTIQITDGANGAIDFTTNGTGAIKFNDMAYVPQQALTSTSNAVAWDAQAKSNAYHVTTENTIFSAPTNAVEGAFVCLEINYSDSHTIGWNTIFEFAASTEPTTTDTDTKTDIFVFRYNGAIWQEVGRTLNLSES